MEYKETEQLLLYVMQDDKTPLCIEGREAEPSDWDMNVEVVLDLVNISESLRGTQGVQNIQEEASLLL